MIGIIPAAGMAKRMNYLPKMMLPTPQGTLIEALYAKIALANPTVIRVGMNPYTRTCINHPHYEQGLFRGHDVGFTPTMSATVLALCPDTPPSVLFGMPDTYFDDANAFVKLAAELKDGADVAVGVFQTRPEQRHKLGMVDITPGDEVLRVYDKPAETSLTWAWGVLAWKPRFWQYIEARDPHVGYALPRALAAELDVRAVRMDGGYWDCGTPDEYFDLIAHLHGQKVTT